MELKDILGFVDIGDVKTVDEFKEKFNAKFSPKSELDELDRKLKESTGKMTGSATTLFKRLGELESKDIEGKKWEEIAELAINKYKNQIKELEGKAGQTNEEALKDLNKKLEKLSKERDDYKTATETLQSTYDKEKGEWEGKFKSFKIGNHSETAKAKIASKLKTDMSAAEKLGFDAALKEFVLDLDDKENPIVKDKDGNRLQNKAKAGSFLTLEEAYELKANELNLIKKNNGGANPGQNFFAGNQNQNNNGGEPAKSVTGRTIHPSALTNAEKQKSAQR